MEDTVATIIALIAVEFFLSLENSAFNAKNLQYASRAGRIFFLTGGSIFSLVFVRIGGPLLLFSILMEKNPIDIGRLMITHNAEYVNFLKEHQRYIDFFNGGFLAFLGIQNIEYLVSSIRGKISHIINTIFIVFLAVLLCLIHIKIAIAALLLSLIVLSSLSVNFLAARIVNKKKTNIDLSKKRALGGEIMLLLGIEYTDMLLSFDSSLTVYSFTNKLPLIMMGIGIGLLISRVTTVLLSKTRQQNLSYNKFMDKAMVIALFSTGAVLLTEQLVHLNTYVVTLTAPAAIVIYVIYVALIKVTKKKILH